MKRRYERYYAPDPRDYPLAAAATTRRKRTWAMPIVLDQGSAPTCVGCAVAGLLACQPLKQYLDPVGIYEIAQFLDEWEGQNYSGTSVRAGVKVIHHLGFLEKYQWTTDVQVTAWQILERGPVVLGVDWYAQMDTPDAEGIIRAKGRRRGGHAVLANGVDTQRELFTITNSWSKDWGKDGRCFLPFEDAAKLFAQDGEVVCCVERKVSVPS
jgi:hypothetical protein